MSRIFQALTAEPWAIVPSELQKIAAIVQRHSLPDAAAKGEPEYQKRDYQLMAGPGAQRLAGTNRAFLIDGVAILPITGPIFPRANMMTEYSGATSINTLTDDYRKALDSAEVGAIMLLLDSPGGAVSGINAFADIVAAGGKKKVHDVLRRRDGWLRCLLDRQRGERDRHGAYRHGRLHWRCRCNPGASCAGRRWRLVDRDCVEQCAEQAA